jgi:DNA-binding GntR family transcriptional regulator
VPEFANDLGISTTPVREALLELSRCGLRTPMRHRGFRVEATAVDDLNNLFALRARTNRTSSMLAARKSNNRAC